MPSSREDSTSTNYQIKVESDGFNIPEIDHLVAGDRLTFHNEDSMNHTLSFSPPGLSGVLRLLLEPNVPREVSFAEGDGDCVISCDIIAQGVGDVIALKIKVGGRTEK